MSLLQRDLALQVQEERMGFQGINCVAFLSCISSKNTSLVFFVSVLSYSMFKSPC